MHTCFSPAMSWSKALKTLLWYGDDGDESCLAIGALDQLIAGEKHICLLGASSPIDQTRRSGIFGLLGDARGPFLVASAMVMWVSLAVGRWPLVA
jgi:hypothetical protein